MNYALPRIMGAYSEMKPISKLAQAEVCEIGPNISAAIHGASYSLVTYNFRL
jgi:hypothetical protein